jgi:outer membrane protein, multidrug efflux system
LLRLAFKFGLTACPSVRSTAKAFSLPALVASAMIVGGGCASSVEPPVTRAALPAPSHWATAPAAAVTDVSDAWIRALGGGTLEELVTQALAHNHDLGAATARVRQAAAQARLAGAERWPQLAANLSASRAKSVTPNPFTSLPGDPNAPLLPELLETQITRFGLSADLSWEADLWGRLSDGTRAARATFTAAQADYAAARLALAGEVARRWFDFVEARQQLVLAEQTEASFRAQERIVTRRFETGTSTALDVRLARTSARTASANVAALHQQVDALARALDVLLGRYPDRSVDAEAAWPELPPIPAAGIPAELVQRRPDLVAAEARYAAAAHERGVAHKLRYPRLTLNASVGTASTKFSDLLDSDFGVWSLVGGLTAPLFTAGRVRAQIDAAEAAEEAALRGFASTLLTAYREVETSLAAERSLADREVRVSDLAAEAVQAEEQAWEQYQRGLVEISAVLEAQRRAFDSRSQLLSVRSQRRQNRATLHLALGGDLPLVDSR